jgi:regulator of Ty1 transposition protein 103
MAFTDDAVKSKLSALNETQEAIVTVAQWIMFHRRHADRTAQLWMQRLKESPPNKKLNLIYLANEVVQQSKMRKKMDFVDAYSPIIAEATTAAYRGSSSDVQQKIRRVIEVWRQRQIFDLPIQESIEKAVDEVDRTKSSNRKAPLGGSLFSSSSSSVPTDLQPLVPLQTALSKADLHAKPTVTSANEEYVKLTNPANPVPTPPVHAARLATLLKNLANAEGAVAESIKARQALITGLEKLLETNKTNLEKDEQQRAALTSKKNEIENRKRDVEDAIMRGLSASESGPKSSTSASAPEPTRPDIEELTPPPIESFTPVGSPGGYVGDDILPTPSSHPIDPTALPPPLAPSSSFGIGAPNPVPGADLLASLTSHTRPDSATNGQGYHVPATGTFKKRKLSRADDDEFAAFAGDGEMENIDADVGGLLDG